jgi:hypothetical protein
MCAARVTYITPLSAANYRECDWIAVSTHHLVGERCGERGIIICPRGMVGVYLILVLVLPVFAFGNTLRTARVT